MRRDRQHVDSETSRNLAALPNDAFGEQESIHNSGGGSKNNNEEHSSQHQQSAAPNSGTYQEQQRRTNDSTEKSSNSNGSKSLPNASRNKSSEARSRGSSLPRSGQNGRSSVFADANQLESTLLPPPPPSSSSPRNHDVSTFSSSAGRLRRVQLMRGKDNSRHYYQLKKQPTSPAQSNYNSDQTQSSSWRPSSKRTTSPRLRTGSSSGNPNDKHQSVRSSDASQRVFPNDKIGNYTPSSTFASLLPPPLSQSAFTQRTTGNFGVDESENPSSSSSPGLSSWEDFLGTVSSLSSGNRASHTTADSFQKNEGVSSSNAPSQLTTAATTINAGLSNDTRKHPPDYNVTRNADERNGGNKESGQQQLPAFGDLFPPSLSSSPPKTTTAATVSQSSTFSNIRDGTSSSSCSLEGVLPVSDLFYNSTSSSSVQNDFSFMRRRNHSVAAAAAAAAPNNNRLTNSATQQQPSKEQLERIKKAGRRKETGRKMVRRGMEMLVGGVPISADPPQRAIEIFYQANKDHSKWASVICTNAPEFGPLLYRNQADSVTPFEQGLFCEYFANYAIKWDVCPDYLKEIVSSHLHGQLWSNTTYGIQAHGNAMGEDRFGGPDEYSIRDEDDIEDIDDNDPLKLDHVPTHDEEDEEDGMLLILVRPQRSESAELSTLTDTNASDSNVKSDESEEVEYEFHIGKIEIEINVPGSLLNSSNPDPNDILKSVLTRGVHAALGDRFFGMTPRISRFAVSDDVDHGSTKIAADFVARCCVQVGAPDEEVLQRAKEMVAAFARAAEGEISLGAARAARQETRWLEEIRERVADEFLDHDDDDDDDDDDGVEGTDDDDTYGDEEDEGKEEESDQEDNLDEEKRPSENLMIPSNSGADLFLPGRQEDLILPKSDDLVDRIDEVFFNYSAANALAAPYKGEIGLRLVDAVVERAKERHPRVIAIGDVHGCIDELKDLLRKCDYRPGDLVVFLGDLVCKGPDSTSVVQMAREIGALGVRGNHDFEVVRWHRAIQAGVDPPSPRSEHFFIASRLGKDDVQWMYNLPWYIASNDLSALFVHAGFVSGIRLAKQNPRLMMNMRSILPDGTVTSKFFNNWPWARLWDGPQTVLFGHDADRGLQQYEHAIGLDTGCVYGGRLTACILPERRFVSVNARSEYFKYRRKHYD
ncbi:hypothetical protein ACA910_003204 [Epithemia clementina (nom. ined.)]